MNSGFIWILHEKTEWKLYKARERESKQHIESILCTHTHTFKVQHLLSVTLKVCDLNHCSRKQICWVRQINKAKSMWLDGLVRISRTFVLFFIFYFVLIFSNVKVITCFYSIIFFWKNRALFFHSVCWLQTNRTEEEEEN